jgi:hypothetical protein
MGEAKHGQLRCKQHANNMKESLNKEAEIVRSNITAMKDWKKGVYATIGAWSTYR